MSKKYTGENRSLTLEALLQFTPDLYLILDKEFKIVAMSQAYAKATHINPKEVLGKHIFEVFPDNPGDARATGVKNLRASLTRVIKDKIPNTMAIQKYDISYSQKGEEAFEEHYWSPINSPVLNQNKEVEYIIHRVEDVTEFVKFKNREVSNQTSLEKMEIEIYHRAQQIQETNKRLHESGERLRLFLDSCNDYALVTLNEVGLVTTWNTGAEKMKGYCADEIIGKDFSIFYTAEANELNLPKKALHSAKIHSRYEEEGWQVKKDGSKFWANTIITPIYNQKKELIGYGKVTRDLTDKKLVEELKNEFISIVSHELRTPLTSIRGSLGLLDSDDFCPLPEKAQNLLQIAKRNCERLVRLINDILDIEKIEAGKMAYQFKPITLNSLIQEVIDANKSLTNNANLTIHFKPNEETVVLADYDKLSQVVTNLLSNAIQHSNPNGTITIDIQPFQNKVRVLVIDNGHGIPPEFRNKIFQKFSQANMSNSKQKGGTGLGLSIAKAIIEKHGGEIGYTSEPNVGTTFFFDLLINYNPGQNM